ncbi:MAG TPA: hypothetical protein VM450_02070, partial [Thermomicrobiales bacterium]|nr:hypothetical protein [Thermomicrobiales bacterium]
PYAFRRWLETVHQPDRRDPEAQPAPDEVAIGEGWSIVIARNALPVILTAAQDLQHYFLVSMGESLLLRRVNDVAAVAVAGDRVIVLATQVELPEMGDVLATPRGYRLTVTPERVVVRGADDRGAGQGSYYLEDLMNLRGAPFLHLQDVTREPLFSPRMTHSGWGLDEFPDAYLSRIAHAGMDSILVFVTGPDRTPDEGTHIRDKHGHTSPGRYRDLNNLVDRAERYGLDVYFYAYFHIDDLPHPADPGAEAVYARVYGDVFRACPRAKGMVLVGESVEFPSKDPRTTGKHYLTPTPDGLPATKPPPGWWPSTDYPEWIEMLKTVVRRHNPDADIVFWTYNWGYAPEEDRLALVRAIPTDVTLLVTFEMFEPIEREGVREVTADYTASFAGPGAYFRSEAAVARERGLRLYTMCNTGGLTWDFGDIPYEPIPYQWARRHAALRDAREQWGLSGLMESHHFGWWPSFVSDLAKANYWTPGPASDDMIAAIARRDFGEDAAPFALAAWRDWSEAILDYVPTNEDQYGPFRIGASYPLVFKHVPRFPIASHAMFGEMIFRTDYRADVGSRAPQTAGPVRIGPQIRLLQRMAERWGQGLEQLDEALARTPACKRQDAERMRGLAAFMLAAVQTTIRVKQWWRLRQRLFGEADRAAARALLDEMVALAEREIANAEAMIPVVAADSRLGWEPSMDYVCSPDHLRWKIAQVRHVIDHEIPAYRAALNV